jgi:toxin-antitoxin system PIN domain toxin
MTAARRPSVATLLDANVLIALLVDDHVHHDAAETWFSASSGRFATCPSTEGSLMRILIRAGQTADAAQAVITQLSQSTRHEFWPGSLSYREVQFHGVIGHRQVTDAYLAQLVFRDSASFTYRRVWCLMIEWSWKRMSGKSCER